MKFKRVVAFLLVLLTVLSSSIFSASAYSLDPKFENRLKTIYSQYDFAEGWGIYDISGDGPKLVAGYNEQSLFQSNCTIKSAMLYYLCKEMDAGRLSLNTKIFVDPSTLHYKDFPGIKGQYKVRYIIDRMIHVSNSAAYEVLLRYVTMEKFNQFLKSIGSGTVITSYNFMGYCTIQNRSKEWYSLYKYCHSNAEHADFAWRTLRTALYSPIRIGLARPVAHKCGWYSQRGLHGTASDCAVVSTKDGGCYLMIIFTKNNQIGGYNLSLIRRIARVLDDVWSDYYNQLPPEERRKAAF